MQNNVFKNRLKLLIGYMDMTQKEFSEFTGVRESTVSNYCVGICEPSQRNLSKIIDSTNVNPAWLMGYGSDDEIENTVR